MSYVFASPDLIAAATENFAGIGSAVSGANAAAAASTTQLLAAGADEVSARIAALFGLHGQEYQALSARAAAFHEQFTAAFASTANAYATAEATNVGQILLDLINAPTQFLLGRPLIGNGSNATTPGGNGGDGGILWGDGGNGAPGAAGQAGGAGGSAGNNTAGGDSGVDGVSGAGGAGGLLNGAPGTGG
ncbi:hypothetical protein LRC484719_35450 [Mycobacterium riyadhense]